MQDIINQTIEVISANRYGVLSKEICLSPFYSPDGNKVAFYTKSDKFSPNQTHKREYELVIKDIHSNFLYFPNTDINGVFGNNICPLLLNNDLNKDIYPAKFSPDSTKILFLSQSTNLINDDNANINEYRWYVKELYTGIIHRVAYNGTEYGNARDDFEALWLDDNRIVFTSYSSNLVPEILADAQDVYIRNLSNDNIELISRRENGNPSPFLELGCFNISICNTKIAFFSALLGYCIKDLDTSTLTRVQDLSGLSSEFIVTAKFFNFNQSGNRALFRLSNNTVADDTNNSEDDFIYNFDTDSIEYINETEIGEFGNSTSKDSKFSPNGLQVGFLSNSTNLSIDADNGKFNLYVKDLITNELTRVIPNGVTIPNDILGFVWLSNDEICFTTTTATLLDGSTNFSFTIKWYYANLVHHGTILINTYLSNTQFAAYNDILLRRDLFDYDLKKILFVTNPETLNYAVNSQGYNIPNIFSKTFIDSTIDYPSELVYSHPIESINSNVTSDTSSNAYTFLDNIAKNPTLSIVASTYTERVNSIQYRNNLSSDIRWMSISYPELPDSLPTGVARVGAGIFLATPTLIDDYLSIRKDITPSNLNPVIGTLVSFEARPRNDVVIIYAGEPQTAISVPVLIYLEATIRGNESGHTFLWEQITGIPVAITQVSNTQAYFTRDTTGVDLVFRYWIDKGRPNEQYKDTIVYGTPTSNYNKADLSVSYKQPTHYDDYLYIQNTLEFNIPFDEFIPFNSEGDKINIETDEMSWRLPQLFHITPTNDIERYISIFKGTVVQGYDTNLKQWYDIITITSNNKRIVNGITPIIRLASIYQELYHPEFRVYSMPIYVNSSAISNHTVYTKSNFSTASTYNNTHRINDIISLTYETDYIEYKWSTNYSNYIHRINDIGFLVHECDYNKYKLSNSNIYLNLTRLSGGNIGG